MSKRGSNSEPFAHENDALTARPQLHILPVDQNTSSLSLRTCVHAPNKEIIELADLCYESPRVMKLGHYELMMYCKKHFDVKKNSDVTIFLMTSSETPNFRHFRLKGKLSPKIFYL